MQAKTYTVAELIAALAAYPPDAPVKVWGPDCAGYCVAKQELIRVGRGSEAGDGFPADAVVVLGVDPNPIR